MAAHATVDRVTEVRCFPCGPCLHATVFSLVNMDLMPMEDTPTYYHTRPLVEEEAAFQNT
jgi:hypothetical protein